MYVNVLAVCKDTLLVFNVDDTADSSESYDDAITAGAMLEHADGVVLLFCLFDYDVIYPRNKTGWDMVLLKNNQ